MTILNLLHRVKLATLGSTALLAAASGLTPASAATIVYDDFDKPGYKLEDYNAKWSLPYGPLQMGVSDTRDFSNGNFAISAAPFTVGADASVFDHLKYLGVSNTSFAVPGAGSITFSSTINTTVTGVQEGRIIEGTYIESGLPYAQATHVAQQAAAVMNMIDFETGQLFDIFISGGQAMTLIERLPSSVTGSPNFVGIDKMYTQIIDVVEVGAGPHDVAITYNAEGSVSYFIDGVLISHVDNVGIPLANPTEPYPAYGPGELLAGKIHSFTFGAGLFSLLDAFPFQHPDRPDLAVSIPMANRLFGQGISATFDNVTVTTNPVPEPASWALMIGGFALAGATMRRRKVAVSFA